MRAPVVGRRGKTELFYVGMVFGHKGELAVLGASGVDGVFLLSRDDMKEVIPGNPNPQLGRKIGSEKLPESSIQLIFGMVKSDTPGVYYARPWLTYQDFMNAGGHIDP